MEQTKSFLSVFCIIYTISKSSNMEIEKKWFQQMLNSQLPFPFFFKEGYIVFIGRED